MSTASAAAKETRRFYHSVCACMLGWQLILACEKPASLRCCAAFRVSCDQPMRLGCFSPFLHHIVSLWFQWPKNPRPWRAKGQRVPSVRAFACCASFFARLCLAVHWCGHATAHHRDPRNERIALPPEISSICMKPCAERAKVCNVP